MTSEQLAELMVAEVRRYVADAVTPVMGRIATLESQLAERDATITSLKEQIQGALSADQVKAMVGEAIAAIPVPKDASAAVEDVVAAIFPQILDVVSRSVDDAVARMPAPKDGASVTVDDVAPMIAGEVQRAVAALPAPKDGASVTVEDVAPLIADQVSKAISDLPAPKDGTSVTLDDVAPLIAGEVERAVAQIPTPKDGTSVTVDDVAPMVTDLVQRAVADLPAPAAGKDGVGISGAMIDQEGDLILSLSDGTTKTVGRVKGQDADPIAIIRQVTDAIPVPRDGRDGVATRDELVALVNDAVAAAVPDQVERSVTMAAQAWPRMEYRDVWKEGEAYRKGDVVTWAGSGWVCRADETTGKPGTGTDWRLFVKKGRDAVGS